MPDPWCYQMLPLWDARGYADGARAKPRCENVGKVARTGLRRVPVTLVRSRPCYTSARMNTGKRFSSDYLVQDIRILHSPRSVMSSQAPQTKQTGRAIRGMHSTL
jgi:hypothetical protein